MLCIPNATDVFRILLKNKTFVNNLLRLLIWPRLLLICNVYICKYNIEYMIVKKADNGLRGHHHFVSCAQCISYHEAIGRLVITGRVHGLPFWLHMNCAHLLTSVGFAHSVSWMSLLTSTDIFSSYIILLLQYICICI